MDTLRRGGVVAAPTESYFGLLADASDPIALDRLFAIKQRDRGVALIAPDRATWAALVEQIPPLAMRLADAFWPGPLTIALPARGEVDARLVVDGTVGVRVPGPSIAFELAVALGRPVTATSANLHRAPPATTDVEVRVAFHSHVDAGRLRVVAGRCPGGAPSSVVVVRKDVIFVARPGAISVSDIEAAGRVAL